MTGSFSAFTEELTKIAKGDASALKGAGEIGKAGLQFVGRHKKILAPLAIGGAIGHYATRTYDRAKLMRQIYKHQSGQR